MEKFDTEFEEHIFRTNYGYWVPEKAFDFYGKTLTELFAMGVLFETILEDLNDHVI